MGQNGLNALLSLAGLEQYIDDPPPNTLDRQFDFAHMAALNQALEDMYGGRGGRGIALRIGRACFSRGLRDFGAFGGVSDPAFQALSMDDRIFTGLKALAAIFNNFSDQHTEVEDDDNKFQVIVDDSPMAWGRQSDKPVCHALGGIMQECLRWVSNGYEFYLQEVSCHAVSRDECIFTINKKPIGRRQ